MNRFARTGFAFLALVVVLAAVPPPATALVIFSTGQYGTPETISLAPPGFGAYGGAYYFIPDARLGQIWLAPIAGGPPTGFLPSALGQDALSGALFLPPGWGANSGKFLTGGAHSMSVFDSAGTMSIFDPATGAFRAPLIAPAGFGTYGGHLFVSDFPYLIWRADPAGGGLTVFKDFTGDPFAIGPFGIEFTPSGFGSFGNRLLVSNASSGSIVALAAGGTQSAFATVPLAAGQVGLRQMLMTPVDYFLDSLGIPGPLLLLSISGSPQGGGTLGALVVLDSTGAVVAHLRVGDVLVKFDPRGMVFTGDGDILVADTSDPIYLASPEDFIAGSGIGTLTELSPAHLWIGLKSSDDQGTQFDLKVEFLRNGTPVTSGVTHCITGVTRNPDSAREAVVSFDAFAPVVVTGGDALELRVSTRIGTNPDGSKCAGPGGSHNNATGLRLYYDASSRASKFDTTITDILDGDLYLRSDGNACANAPSTGVIARFLDDDPPTAANAKCKDSSVVNFAGGNPFIAIGTWSLPPLP